MIYIRQKRVNIERKWNGFSFDEREWKWKSKMRKKNEEKRNSNRNSVQSVVRISASASTRISDYWKWITERGSIEINETKIRMKQERIGMQVSSREGKEFRPHVAPTSQHTLALSLSVWKVNFHNRLADRPSIERSLHSHRDLSPSSSI